jgi:fructoselysine-6-phosphate deglycase
LLNFDERRFLEIQSGAIALASQIREAMADSLRRGAKSLFFLGTGGAAILMLPAAQLLQRQSSFPVFAESTAELVIAGHRHLGPHSLIVMPSLSGTTKESLSALDYCRSRGARVIAMTGHADSALAKAADVSVVNFAEDDTSSESFYLQSLFVALALMEETGERQAWTETLAELQHLPKLLCNVKREFEARAEAYAETIKAEPYHIISAAGACWPEAWYYGMCILEEMQWIRTRPVHAADLFHGTLELVEQGVSCMLFKGEDAYRPVAERAERFLARHTDKLFVLDTASFKLGTLSAPTRALVSPIVLATALERLSAHLEVKRSHPLTTRRYYKRIDY